MPRTFMELEESAKKHFDAKKIGGGLAGSVAGGAVGTAVGGPIGGAIGSTLGSMAGSKLAGTDDDNKQMMKKGGKKKNCGCGGKKMMSKDGKSKKMDCGCNENCWPSFDEWVAGLGSAARASVPYAGKKAISQDIKDMKKKNMCGKKHCNESVDHTEGPRKHGILDNYMDVATSGDPINGCDDRNSSWELRPMTDQDMATAHADDVVDWYAKHGKNTKNIGAPLTDKEFAKYTGLKEAVLQEFMVSGPRTPAMNPRNIEYWETVKEKVMHNEFAAELYADYLKFSPEQLRKLEAFELFSMYNKTELPARTEMPRTTDTPQILNG